MCIQDLLQSHQPDVLILTETKASPRNIKRTMHNLSRKGYWQFHSTTSEAPQAGVSILVHEKFCHLGMVQEIPHHGHLKGYIKTIQISHPSSTPL